MLSLLIGIVLGASGAPEDRARLVGSRPINRPYWVTDRDFPRNVNGAVGRTDFAVTISPEGMPQSCVVTETSQNATLDKTTCELIMSRARFTPGLDKAGQPIASVFKTAIVWGQDFRPVRHDPDLDLHVPALPPGIASPVTVLTRVLLDEKGAVESCDGVRDDDPDALKDLACQKVTANLHVDPVRDENGKPERALIGAAVRLTASPDEMR